jgi:hypothetical protein
MAEARGFANDSTQLRHLLLIKSILQILEIPPQLLPG